MKSKSYDDDREWEKEGKGEKAKNACTKVTLFFHVEAFSERKMEMAKNSSAEKSQHYY